MSNGVRFSTFAVIFSLLMGCAAQGVRDGGRGNQGGDGNGTPGGGGGNGIPGGGKGGGIILPPTACGDGKLDTSSEECDDKNPTSGDGCTRSCRIEADWSCPTPGAPCINMATCGDGRLAGTEACDDGNAVAGDGCSADCKMVEMGFQCRVPGKHCVPLCGDSKLTAGESCDDGNTVAGDGCSSTCLTEPGSSCPTVGAPCIKSVCGNSMTEAGESCDKGPQNGLFLGDATGCSKTCTQEPNCRTGGMTGACKTPCGDGNVDPGEACDDGNQVDKDGCSKTCMVEAGFTCTPKTNPDAQMCTGGAGQCLVLPIIYRDFDGMQAPTGHPDFFFYGATPAGGSRVSCVPNASGANLLPQQPNGSCPTTDATDPCQGLVTATLGADGKPSLSANGSMCKCTFTDWDKTGILTGAAGVMQCASGAASPQYVQNVPVKVIQSADSFKQWYNDSALSTKVLTTLELAQQAGGNQYQFSSSAGRTVYDDIHDIWRASKTLPALAGAVTSLTSGFFPLETSMRPKVCNLWSYWNAPAGCIANDGLSVWQQWDPRAWNSGGMAPQPNENLGAPIRPVTGVQRNFYFTSEVRYLFRFAGGETLSFFGDDDVWVFINGKLVLDLGAPHERMKGTVTLDMAGATATWNLSIQNLRTGMDQAIPGAMGSGMVTGLGLEVGKTYEIAIFHADRHPRESNYQLTLSGYSTTRSECTPKCGDNVATAAEECDEGPMNMDGVYGGCTTMCKFGPFCGDGVTTAPEECDAGRENNKNYGEMGCTSGCKLPHRCGDGFTDGANGEDCDDGPNNGKAACTTDCKSTTR